MALAVNTRIGPYQILGPIGAGGMGEVYQARDTRLLRTVAIKVLPPHATADKDCRARFEREARAISGLAHPNICALYDVGEHDGSLFLVMEHLTGETLAARLTKGALLLEQTLTIGAQIADALAAAHRQGVIHRDLKPGNVMLTRTGAKLLDFGLAKVTAFPQGGVASLTSLTAQESPITTQGTILGTLMYMAPEQLEGRDADARSDLFALGAVLYEMITGHQAFQGESPAGIVGAIMTSQPTAIVTLQPQTPLEVNRVICRCLAKDPDARWQSAADLAQELRWLGQAGRSEGVSVPRKRWSRVTMAVVFLVIGAAGAAILSERYLRSAPMAPPSHVTVSIASNGLELTGGGLAVSPDGRTLAFGARAGDDDSRLYVRDLDDWTPRPLTGTEGASTPFFSPDGDWLAFVVGGVLKKIQLRGGSPQSICRITYQGFSRGHWGTDNQIFFSQWPGGLWRVSAEGGAPQQVKAPSDAGRYLWPQALPGGKAMIFTMVNRGRASVAALSFSTGDVRTVIDSGANARYLPTGHIVYESEGHLRAVPFDADGLEMRGASRVVIDDIATGQYTATSPAYDVSRTGTVVYASASTPKTTLVWRDRTGNVVPLKFGARSYSFPSLSSDGRLLTVTVTESLASSVWVGSADGEPLSRLTPANNSMCSMFSRDRMWVVFTSNENGWFNLFKIRADGSGEPERLREDLRNQKPTSWSPRDVLLFNEIQTGNRDIVEIDMANPGASRPFVSTPANELEAAFSPDGRWVAFQSDKSGTWEIYVQPYGGAEAARQVSIAGGTGPVWNPKGGELFYQAGSALMAVRVENGIAVGPPTKLFSCRRSEDYRREFDVSPDGQRFLFLEPATHRSDINVISNWFDELRTQVPPGR